MCGCAYHLSKIPACTSAFCNNPLAMLYLRYYWHVASHPDSKKSRCSNTQSAQNKAHTPSTFKICVSLVFSSRQHRFHFHHLTRTLTNLSTQWGHLRMIIRACVNGPRALVIYTHGRRIKKVMFHSPAFLGNRYIGAQ